MNLLPTLSLTLLLLPTLGIAQTKLVATQPFTIGETVEVFSKELQENRLLNIYLPPGYSPDSAKQYPVIYLLDGSADEDFIHIAGLVQFGTFPWVEMLPESIVVGIANIDRRRDYTYPTHNERDKKDNPTSGGSAKFIQFVSGELIPFVENRYHTNGVKTVIGQSLGGLLAAEILLKKPEMFINYIIISPSLWWDDESLLQQEPKASRPGQQIYVAVGKEGEVMERTAILLADKHKKRGWRTYFQYYSDKSHANILHMAVYDAFEKIFQKEEEKK